MPPPRWASCPGSDSRALTGSVRRRQQLAGCRLQPLGKFDNQLERRITLRALDAGNVGPVNIRLQGKGLLRQVERLSGRFTKRKCDDESVDD